MRGDAGGQAALIFFLCVFLRSILAVAVGDTPLISLYPEPKKNRKEDKRVAVRRSLFERLLHSLFRAIVACRGSLYYLSPILLWRLRARALRLGRVRYLKGPYFVRVLID